MYRRTLLISNLCQMVCYSLSGPKREYLQQSKRGLKLLFLRKLLIQKRKNKIVLTFRKKGGKINSYVC